MALFKCLFVVLTLFSSSLCQGAIKKCCDEYEFLMQNYTCGQLVDDGFQTDHIPLKLGLDTNFTYGFPEKCNASDYKIVSLLPAVELPDDYCVEKFLDPRQSTSQIVLVKCEKLGLKVMRIKTIYKCCQEGMVFDLNDHKCVIGSSDTNLFDVFIKDEAHLLDVRHNTPICSYPQISYQYSGHDYELYLKNGSLYLGKSGKSHHLKHGSYCLDDSVQGPLVARSCKDECEVGPCVSKCCPEGEVYQNDPQNCKQAPKCRPSNLGFSPVFYNVTDLNAPVVVPVPETVGIRYGRDCDKYYLKKAELNYLDVNTGDLIVPTNEIDGPRLKDYCTEAIVNHCKSGNMKVFKFVCKTQEDNALHEKLWIYGVGLYISCTFLILTILVYSMIPQLRNFHGKIVMCHVISMIMAFLCLARTQISEVSPMLYCKSLGYILHFSLLSAFFWLNVMCIDIWMTFGHVRSPQDMDRKKDLIRLLKYSLYGWGVPALATLITFIIDINDVAPGWLDPNVGLTDCWISTRHSRVPWIILFILPVGLLIGINFVMFLFTIIYCNRVKSKINKMQSGDSGDKNKKRFLTDKNILFMNIKLFMVMGMAWMFELLSSFFTEPELLWTIGDIINILQGIPIFCILILKKNVFVLMKKKLGFKEETRDIRSGQTNTTGFTTDGTSSTRRVSNIAMTKGKSSNSSLLSK